MSGLGSFALALSVAFCAIGSGTCAPAASLLAESRARPGGGMVHCRFGTLQYEITGKAAVGLVISSTTNTRAFVHRVAVGGKWESVSSQCHARAVPQTSEPNPLASWEILIQNTECGTQLDGSGDMPVYHNQAFVTVRVPRTSNINGAYTEKTVIVPFSCEAISETFVGGNVALAEQMEVLDNVTNIFAIPLTPSSLSVFKLFADFETPVQVMQVTIDMQVDAVGEYLTRVDRCWLTKTAKPVDVNNIDEDTEIAIIEDGKALDEYVAITQTTTGALIEVVTVKFEESSVQNFLQCRSSVCWKKGSTEKCHPSPRLHTTKIGGVKSGSNPKQDPFAVATTFRGLFMETPKLCYRNKRVVKC